MVCEQVSIGFLADHEDTLATVSEWLVHEWGDRQSSTAVDEFAESLRSRIGRDRIPLQLVAMLGGRVVGIAMLKKHELRAVHPELANWLGSVFVAPEFRGRGIASMLAEDAVERARALGIRVVHLQTEDLSGGLYARLGWKPLHSLEYEGVRRLVMVKEVVTDGASGSPVRK